MTTLRDTQKGPAVRGTMLAGVAVILLGLGGFTAWAGLMPLSSASIAPGVVQVETNRKPVQHRDGGIVAELLVREGDRVSAGDLLLRLDDAESRATFGMLETHHLSLLAQESRLLAERDGLPDLMLPPDLAAAQDRPDVAEIVAGQRRIFAEAQRTLAGQEDILRNRIAQHEAQIAAFEAQRVAGREQLSLIAEESAGVGDLIAKGLERKPRLLSLKRAAAQLAGAQGDYDGRIAEAREAISEAELQILHLRKARTRDAAVELRDVQTRRVEADERLRAARIGLARYEVRAPQAGIVMNLKHFAPGAVIPPGGEILDIVPQEERLLVDARVRPTDIDAVRPGLPASVVLSAYKSRTTPPLDGTVLLVSADALADERSGQTYYRARIAIDPAAIARLDTVALYPGMPAEAIIVTGERTALDYLLDPLRQSFRRAFRED